MTPATTPGVAVVHVVIPAHDEEQHVRRCLESVLIAAAAARATYPTVAVRATLVLDACTDGTAAIAAALGVDTLAVDARTVGAARHAGVEHVRRRAAGRDAQRVWVATTDADTVVPTTWLLDHLDLAGAHDVVVGAVRPDPTGLTPVALREWERRHPAGGRYVHGANLGFRLAAYDAVGGFEAVTEHEDVRLVAALEAAGHPVAHGSVVVTSARQVGRTGGGFAGYLAALSAAVD